MFENLAREVQISTISGMSIGGTAAWLVWLIRGYENLNGHNSNETPELQLSIDSINYDDTEDVKSSSSELFKKSPRGLCFGGEEDEEAMSLIKNKDL